MPAIREYGPGSVLEADLYRPPYYHPGMDSPEIKYLMEPRRELGDGVRPSPTATNPAS